MKNTIRILLLATISVLAAFQAAGADTAPAVQPSLVHQEDPLVRALALSSSQKDQFKAIRAQEETAIQAVKGNAGLTSGQKRAQVESIRRKSVAQRYSILSAEQKAKFSSMRESRAANN